MIEIPGLNALQRDLCDRIWSMESKEEIESWFDTLPRNVQIQAYAMLNLIVAEMLDQEDLDLTTANLVIERVKSC
jgi:hypothetical protein